MQKSGKIIDKNSIKPKSKNILKFESCVSLPLQDYLSEINQGCSCGILFAAAPGSEEANTRIDEQRTPQSHSKNIIETESVTASPNERYIMSLSWTEWLSVLAAFSLACLDFALSHTNNLWHVFSHLSTNGSKIMPWLPHTFQKINLMSSPHITL